MQMQTSFIIYSVIALGFSVFDFVMAFFSLKKPEKIGKALGLAAAFAGITTLSYLVSLTVKSPLMVSVASSVYFASIDWLLVSMAWFTLLITGLGSKWAVRITYTVATLDTLVFVANIFTGCSVEYIPLDPLGIEYRMKLPYILHLIFTYLMVAGILYVLIYKCAHTPRQYMDQFLYIVAAIGFIVAINAVFLFPDTGSFFTKVDCSVLGYSIGLYLLYWAAFSYRQSEMIRDLSITIFDNIGQGIVLFDYSDRLIMRNRRAEALLYGLSFRHEMSADDFLAQCGIIPVERDEWTVQCDVIEGRPLRCDYRRIRDKRGKGISRLFVFTDISSNTDITSGFEYEQGFDKAGIKFVHPTAVAVFDITGLGSVNKSAGRDAGDRLIRTLAKLMQRCMPVESYFLRGYEANLIAVCPNRTEADVIDGIARVAQAFEHPLKYGVCGTAIDVDPARRRDILQALEVARHSIQVKKLLSDDSVRSQTLKSLVRTLEEVDNDTREHVARTQKTGAMLGERIGLSDAELADLSLLCLLHDIGKIGVPLEILNKPGKLTDQEWAVLRTHAEKGYQIAMSVDEMKNIAELILSHHERWDGKGYPRKLAGEDIPVLSRIIAIVDAYDAMVNDRSYRKAMTPEAARAEILANAGTQFDPRLAKAFLELLDAHPELAAGEKVGIAKARVSRREAESDDQPVGATEAIRFSRYVLNIDDMVVEIDDEFEHITGYSREEAVGRLCQFDLIPEAERAHYIAMVNRQFVKGNIAYLRHHIQRKDGQIVSVVCNGKRFYDSADKAFKSEIVIFTP